MAAKLSALLCCAAVAGICFAMPSRAALALAAVGAGGLLVWLIWCRPEVAIIGLVVLTAGLWHVTDLYLPLPAGGLYAQDVLLLGLLAVLSVRALLTGGLRSEWWPVTLPLLVFLAIGVGSMIYGVAFKEVEPTKALNELRPVFYYSVAMATAMSMRGPSHRTLLLIGLSALADLITAALIVQQFAGEGTYMFPGMAEWQVNDVDGSGGAQSSSFGLTRIVPPAHLLLFVISILSFVWALTDDRRPWLRIACAMQCGFINLGLLLTYTRAQWLASMLALVLIGVLLPRTYGRWLVRGLAVVVSMGLATLILVYGGIAPSNSLPPVVAAMIDRAASVLSPSETLSSSSLQWRVFETEEALRSIGDSPQGVGLGNAYRSITTYAGEAAGYQGEPLNRFVHNSYLFIAVKMGLPGLAVFLCFCGAFVLNGWRLFWRMRDGADRWLVLTLVVCFIGTLQWSVTEPNFMLPGGTSMVGVMVGMAASLRHV